MCKSVATFTAFVFPPIVYFLFLSSAFVSSQLCSICTIAYNICNKSTAENLAVGLIISDFAVFREVLSEVVCVATEEIDTVLDRQL